MAVQEVLFVSQEKLTAYSTININVSGDLLSPHVLQAQEIYLQSLLGTHFYRELKEQIKTGTLTEANRLLMNDYIGNVVLNYAWYLLIPNLKYRFMNHGVVSPKSETSDATKLEEIIYLRKEVLAVAGQYALLLQRFLYYHSGQYPAWTNYNALDGLLPDRSNPYQSPIVLYNQPYQWKKKLVEKAAIGQYGYSLEGDLVANSAQLTCDYPWFLFPGGAPSLL